MGGGDYTVGQVTSRTMRFVSFLQYLKICSLFSHGAVLYINIFPAFCLIGVTSNLTCYLRVAMIDQRHVCLWIMDPHSRAPKKNTSHGNEVLQQVTTLFIHRPCYQPSLLSFIKCRTMHKTAHNFSATPTPWLLLKHSSFQHLRNPDWHCAIFSFFCTF